MIFFVQPQKDMDHIYLELLKNLQVFKEAAEKYKDQMNFAWASLALDDPIINGT
jgi:hypothetical protein